MNKIHDDNNEPRHEISNNVVCATSQSKLGCKDQESIQSSNTPDPGYQLESDKLTVRHHKREPRGQPFPSRCPQGTYKQARTNAQQTQGRKNIKDPQKKHRLGKVSKIFYLRA